MDIRVMVVDDSRFVYEDLSRMLSNTNFTIVKYCRNGESAVEDYCQIKPDIVTMDIVLPAMDGFETAQKIFSQDPDARILFMSSLAYEETMQQAEQIGSNEFIFKPIERDKLLQGLARLAIARIDEGH